MDLHLFVDEDEAAEILQTERTVSADPQPSQDSQMDNLAFELGNGREMAMEVENNTYIRKEMGPENVSGAESRSISLDDLYCSLGVESGPPQIHAARHRLDTIHVRGVDELDTKSVLGLFAAWKPSKVEWVNDTSCNVVFDSDILAAKALLAISRPLKMFKKPVDHNAETDADTGEPVMISDMVSFPIPVPQGKWRVSLNPPPKTKQLIFRFARETDKKAPNAQKFSQFYAKNDPSRLAPLQIVVPSSRSTVPVRREREQRTVIVPQKPVQTNQKENATLRRQLTNQNQNIRTVYVEQKQRATFGGPIFPRVQVDRRMTPPYPEIKRDEKPLAKNDLRHLLLRRSVSHDLPARDLRFRLSQPSPNNSRQQYQSDNGYGNRDLRDRLGARRGTH